MFCTKCGKATANGEKFCTNCGAAQSVSTSGITDKLSNLSMQGRLSDIDWVIFSIVFVLCGSISSIILVGVMSSLGAIVSYVALKKGMQAGRKWVQIVAIVCLVFWGIVFVGKVIYDMNIVNYDRQSFFNVFFEELG